MSFVYKTDTETYKLKKYIQSDFENFDKLNKKY